MPLALSLLASIFSVVISVPLGAAPSPPRPAPKVLVFDVIGSCFEERESLRAQGEAWSREKKIDVDWPGLIAEWMKSHDEAMGAIRKGTTPWVSYNEIYRRDLHRLLPAHAKSAHTFTVPEEEAIYRFWDRLQPRPDVRPGLDALRSRFKLATLSNGDLSNLRALSEFSGIKWDFYFSAEQVHHFKPAREYYAYAASRLQAAPAELMMVASHLYDLEAAHSFGWQTALVARPTETPEGPRGNFDYVVRDIIELARNLAGNAASSKR